MARPELKTKMTLDSRGFQRGLRRVRRLGRDFGRKFGQPIAQATGALVKLGAVAATVTAAGVFLAVKKVSELGDQMDKMSKRTGISTEELSRLGFAAELSGTNIESLEKATKRMSAVILDGEQGLKTATDSFDALGIKMEDVSNKTPEQQLNVFLSALAKVENASTRAALSQEIFGRAGTQLLPMLADGTEGLAKMKAEADKLGIVISKEQAAEAAQFVDEVTRFKKSFTGLLLQAIKFKTVNAVIIKMTTAMVKFRQSAKFREITASVAEFARETVGKAIRIVRAWQSLDHDTRQSLKSMAVGFAGFIILWKTGFIGPFVQLLAALLTQVITILPLIVTNFVVMQGGLAAAAKGIKGVMISIFKAMVVPLVAIVAFIAGIAIGKAIDRAFDLSGSLLKVELRMAAFQANLTARWKLSGDEQAAALAVISEKLKAGLQAIDDVADAPAPDIMSGFRDSIAATLSDIEGLFDKIGIPGKAAIDEIIEGARFFMGWAGPAGAIYPCRGLC